ncbi:MAG: hypothetical protein GY814_11110, partial [Gammaproteobacteria bacterium]|nr:hypothetical protein [Gammaproteobacteria bacterium]
VYNSRGGNGHLGMGWSLAGLSSITRCPATLAQDGFIDGVDFDGNDRFCLDGQRLIAINDDPYGAPGTEYRTEIETFSQVTSHGSAGNGPSYFIVKTKSGRTMEFGNSDDSKIEAQGKNDVVNWALNRVADAYGNYYTVGYVEDNANGEFYPERVDYGWDAGQGSGSSVRFVYQPRGDVRTGYVGGSVSRISQRLVDLKTYAGEGDVRDYRLYYEYGKVTNQSRLVSVTGCDGKNQCFRASSFSWTNASSKFGNTSPSFSTAPNTYFSNGEGEDMGTRLADIDGDGLMDIIQLYLSPQGYYGGVDQKRVYLNKGSDFAFSSTYSQSLPNTYFSNGDGKDMGTRLADMNGDGLMDIIQLYLSPPGYYGGVDQKRVYLNKGSDFAFSSTYSQSLPYTYFSNGDGKDMGTRLADMNGDGLMDIIQLYLSPPG